MSEMCCPLQGAADHDLWVHAGAVPVAQVLMSGLNQCCRRPCGLLAHSQQVIMGPGASKRIQQGSAFAFDASLSLVPMTRALACISASLQKYHGVLKAPTGTAGIRELQSSGCSERSCCWTPAMSGS